MAVRFAVSSLLLGAALAMARAANGSPATPTLSARTTIPIVLTGTISAQKAHPGDIVKARTTQRLRVAGVVLGRGAVVHGHVVTSNSFAFDSTPYARQKPAALSIEFDSLQVGSVTVPLHVTVRAVASPVAVQDASTPAASDMDPLGTERRVGGDLLTPSQKEVLSVHGEVVAYQREDGVYAHLIANGRCDGSDQEVPMGVFSASACGLYGFGDTTAQELGTSSAPSRLTLVSTHESPKVWKGTHILLEVLPEPAR